MPEQPSSFKSNLKSIDVSSLTANLLDSVYRASMDNYDKMTSKLEEKGEVDHI